MDGRVARLLKASSKLGAELDSLADFVNFGVAPAMFMYFWLTGGPTHAGISHGLVRLTLGASLFYAMCDCFRLARFNTMLEQPTLPYWKHFFLGVPAPGGAWMVLSPAVLVIALDAKGSCPALQEALQNPYFGIFMLLFVGSLMASRLPTISLKSVHISKTYLLPVMAALLLVVAMLVSNFWLAIGVIGVLYICTVPITGMVFIKARAKYEREQASAAANASAAG
jgi:CDP-diacylglycerol--serine O-phosphatidyltransferase